MKEPSGLQPTLADNRAIRTLIVSFLAPVAFSVCFLLSYSPLPSDGPDRFVAWPPVCVTLAGATVLMLIIRDVYRAFHNPGVLVIAWAAALLTGVFLVELFLAGWLISLRPM